MPLYVYRCPVCGHREEALVAIAGRDREGPACVHARPLGHVIMIREQTPVAGIVNNPAVPRKRR